jgi:hypothetical protein
VAGLVLLYPSPNRSLYYRRAQLVERMTSEGVDNGVGDNVLREISINGMTNTMLDEHEGVEGDHGEHLIKHKVSFGAGDRVGIENSDPVVLESAKESGGGEVATELTASEGETECVPVAVGFLLFI